MSPNDLIAHLCKAGLIGSNGEARLVPLTGGVSSDIHLVETTERAFVVKVALAKLRVKDVWYADLSRNAVEQDYFNYAARIVPDAVPHILAADPAHNWFAMEYLGGGFVTWKASLLTGDAQPEHARRAGEVIGRLHEASWGDPVARERFATLRNFHALRIDPYLLTTAERLPLAARRPLWAEANRLAATQLALVHGDYSPKNLLIGSGRFVILDAECGWFGDPVFDAAFLLTHLHLKALLHAARPEPLLALVPEFWAAYTAALGPHANAEYEARTVRLLLCLMLARVYGKSPVEYLPTAAQRDLVTEFGLNHLLHPPAMLASFTATWRHRLTSP